MPQPVDRYMWQQQVCGEHGPRSPTTRLVLLAISLYMDSQGGRAWPSQETIARRASVTRRAVVTHLEIAEQLGWVNRYDAGRTGQGWRLCGYEAVVPDDVYASLPARPWETDPTWKRSESRSPPQGEALRKQSARGEGWGSSVVNVPPRRGASDASRGEPRSHESSLPNLPSIIIPKNEGALACTAPLKRVFDEGEQELELSDKDEEARERKKVETLMALLQAGVTPTACLQATRTYRTTMADVEKAKQHLAALEAEW